MLHLKDVVAAFALILSVLVHLFSFLLFTFLTLGFTTVKENRKYATYIFTDLFTVFKLFFQWMEVTVNGERGVSVQ